MTKTIELKCPHCNKINNEDEYPDLYYEGCYDGKTYEDQTRIQLGMQKDGWNVLTCPECGQVVLVKTKYICEDCGERQAINDSYGFQER